MDSIILELHEHLRLGCNKVAEELGKYFDLKWQKGENYNLRKNGMLVHNDRGGVIKMCFHATVVKVLT